MDSRHSVAKYRCMSPVESRRVDGGGGALCVRVLFSHFAEWHTTQRMYGRASIKNSAASVHIMMNYEDMRGYF